MSTATAHPWLDAAPPAANDAPSAVQAWRAESLAAARAAGLPTSRNEEWRYSPAKQLFAGTPTPTAAPDLEVAQRLIDAHATWAALPRLVVVDGVVVPELATALPEGLQVRSLAAALEDGDTALLERMPATDAATQLHQAWCRDGLILDLAANTRLDRPVLILRLSTHNEGASWTQNIVRLGANSHLHLLEAELAGPGSAAFVHHRSQFELGRGARLERVRLQGLPGAARHLHDTEVMQAEESHSAQHLLGLGAGASRDAVRVHLGGTGAHAHFDGLFTLKDGQVADHLTVVDHAVPGCTSSELYKGVLDGQSQGGFTGRIVVREGADRTDATQNNRNLLLSEGSQVAARPQLEILADDVKCSHGATTGFLDEDQLFYLRSRGVNADEARRLLTSAFGREIVERIESDALRDLAMAWLDSRSDAS